jgi:COMPASS component SWD3
MRKLKETSAILLCPPHVFVLDLPMNVIKPKIFSLLPVTISWKITILDSDGTLRHWHVTSGKCVHVTEEDQNQIYAIDYRDDADVFATTGRDSKVRVYDETTKTLISTHFGGRGDVTAGHVNRVFALKFHPNDKNLLISGGWDNTIQLWDLRCDHAIRSIFGPHVCGDSIDLFGDTLLTGSWRPEEQLQVRYITSYF